MPTILHADMDAFYASVEQHDRPELRGKPVIVGGTGPRGVVTTASYEARAYGVHSAMPGAKARELCPHGIFLPGRMKRYAEVSRAIRRVFCEFTPLVEPLSLDEAYLDVTASLRLFGTPLELARRLKARIRDDTGLPVSVGIGPTLMVAKIASALGKPDGLLEISPADVRTFLHPLGVAWIWGIGPVAEEALRRLGVHTIGDLAAAPPAALRSALGSAVETLQELARGIDRRRVDPSGERKSYGEESTFAENQREGDLLRGTIVAHAEAVARRLRADARCARTIVLKLKLARRIAPGKYPLVTRSRTLAEATDDGKTIADSALRLWESLRSGTVVRLVGVAVSNIAPRGDHQLDFFVANMDPRRSALNRAIDTILERYGDGALVRGRATVERASPTVAIKDRR